MTSSNELKLTQPPEVVISSVKFSPNTSQFLLVSSWTALALRSMPFYDPAQAWRGLDHQLKMHDLNTDQEYLVGTHDAPIRCIEYCPEVNVMVTGSWDQTVKLRDPRNPCNARTFSQNKTQVHLIIS
uniref:Uncharacterized protein n=1 Tax=Pan paniscus TaxID=9597 RepID=A0A2R9C131_PANPA